MIGKALIGNSFKACVKYCLQQTKNPVILEQSGVYGDDVGLLTNQFNTIAKQKETVTKKVWHGVVSFAHSDNVSDDLMLCIAKDYLSGLGLANNQYMVVKHQDTEHEHLHLVINRIAYDGKVVDDFQCGYRTMKLMQKLEKKYNLLRAVDQPNKRKEAIAAEIEIGLLNRESVDEILHRVVVLGYAIEYNKTSTGNIRGVSFKDEKKGIVFKASDIKRQYSYTSLVKLAKTKMYLSKSKSMDIDL